MYAIYPSPIGDIYIQHQGQRLQKLKILSGEPADCGSPDSFTDMVYSQIIEYIRGERKSFDIELDIDSLTPFHSSVLKELQQIPYGKRVTYKQVASAVGSPRGSRAVGSACNRNPIHIIIPCHRVVGSSGSLTGYAAGVDTKEFLLNLEQSLL